MRIIITALLSLAAACSQPEAETQRSATERDGAAATLNLSAQALDENRVQFEVETTLPLPVEMMAEVSLKGQAPDDTYIGHTKRVKIEEAKSSFTFDTREAEDPLPTGEYEAEVSFYPRWGAEKGNPAAKTAPELHAKSDVSLAGTGEGRAETERKNELQRWVMGNLGMNEPWNRANYEAKMGKAQKGPSTMSRLHDAYYFPEADVTLLVNLVRNEVTIWRLGDVTE